MRVSEWEELIVFSTSVGGVSYVQFSVKGVCSYELRVCTCSCMVTHDILNVTCINTAKPRPRAFVFCRGGK